MLRNFTHFIPQTPQKIQADLTLLEEDLSLIPQDKTLDTVNPRKEDLLASKKSLLTKKTKCDNFLISLNNKPNDLFNELSAYLQSASDALYENHFLLNKKITDYFSNLDAKISAIRNFTVEGNTTNDQWRNRYGILCGLIWEMNLNLTKNTLNFRYEEFLSELLEKFHLAPTDTINYSVDDFTCQEKFQHFKLQHQTLFFLSEENIRENHLKRFQATYAATTKTAQQNDTILNKAGLNLIHAIKEEVDKTLHQKQYPEELLTHMSLLKTADKIMQHPHEAQGEIMKIANHLQHTSSVANKVKGALIVLAGVSLLSLSLFALAGTLGSSLPASIAGGALAGLIIAKGLAIAGLAIGTGLSGFGCHLFAHGRGSQVYQAAETFAKAQPKIKPI